VPKKKYQARLCSAFAGTMEPVILSKDWAWVGALNHLYTNGVLFNLTHIA
jgi:hypothetical protein